MNDITLPVSPGELIDKMTILEIKSERFKDPAKIANVRYELEVINRNWNSSEHSKRDIDGLKKELKAINEKLWDIEDDIRIKESNTEFDEAFVELARSVYFTNDERARVKKEINTLLGSKIVEEKEYVDYK